MRLLEHIFDPYMLYERYAKHIPVPEWVYRPDPHLVGYRYYPSIHSYTVTTTSNTEDEEDQSEKIDSEEIDSHKKEIETIDLMIENLEKSLEDCKDLRKKLGDIS